MFGKDGDQLKIEWEESWRGAFSGLKSMLYTRPDAFLGIYGGEHELSFLELRQVSGRWELGRRAGEKWQRPEDFGEMASLLAERAAMRLSREGWEKLPLALCLPEAECVCKLFAMSPEIPPEEQKTAAYWEIDNYLQSCGLTQDMVSCTSLRLPGDESTVEAVILFREKIRALEEAFAARDCQLAGLYPESPLLAECRPQGNGWELGRLQVMGGSCLGGEGHPEGERRSFYAAAALAGLGDDRWPENLLGGERQESPWNYEGICKLAMMLIAAVISAVLLFDLGSLYVASRRAEETKQEMAVLETARQVMEADRKLSAQAEQKEACLARLSEQSRPLDSVLVHLGTVTVEGAWLTEVDCTEEKSLLMRGEAVDYSALGEVMEAFEKDQEFFPSMPLLEESRQKDVTGEGIEFRLKLEMGI